MQSCALNFFKTTLVVFALATVSACGPGVRTADGDCYYSGKGILQMGGTLLDGLAAYGKALSEQQYQQNQIKLQQLESKLNSIDLDKLERAQNYAYATDDIYEQSRINLIIAEYNRDVDEYSRLQDSVNDYQERKQKELERGPTKSVSQMVDESGDCK